MARLFTLEEARALLPRLREILPALRADLQALERAQAEVTEQQIRARGNGHHLDDNDAAQREQAARDGIDRHLGLLAELGVELKDPASGLVDFPAEREGRLVLLCWKLDEPDLAWWHPIETGFAGRRPL